MAKSRLAAKLVLAAATLGGETLFPMSLIASADRELYRAKALGRNRVEPASNPRPDWARATPTRHPSR